MRHTALQEVVDGENVTWLEAVSEAQFLSE
jgi:hypothetical protein